MKQLKCIVSGLGCALAVSGSSLASSDYKGADAVLAQIAAAKSQPGKANLDPVVQWIADLKAFSSHSGTLAPKDAARQWLDLAVRYGALKSDDLGSLSAAEQQQMAELRSQGFSDPVLGSLPGPAAWPELAAIIDARPAQTEPRQAAFECALRLLAHTLIADPAGQQKALLSVLDIKDRNFSYVSQQLDIPSLQDSLADRTDDPAGVANAFAARIALQKKLIATHSVSGWQRFSVPDLVTILGSEKAAAPLLTEAILLPGAEIEVQGTETRRLATRLALEQIANLKYPHWELACSLDSAALYEALQKRFPAGAENSDSGQSSAADGYYFLHLIIDRQMDKAVAMAESMKQDSGLSLPLDALNREGYTGQVEDFLHDLLAKHPELLLWDNYIQLAAKTGQTARMLDLIRSAAKRTDLNDAKQGSARCSFYLALLAADQVDEGVAELRKVIASGMRGENTPLEKNVALARIGQLLERKDLLEEGISGAEEHLKSDPAMDLNGGSSTVTSFAELLTQIGRGPEAEQMLALTLDRISALPQPQSKRELLAALMRVYYRAGRPGDVIAVLQKFPGWGASDLEQNFDQDTDGFSIAEYSTHAASDNLPVGYMAAWALAQTGQKDQALKILNALLDQDESFDPGYELLTKLSGADAGPRLDLLARRDRFETRPFIWKAQLQLDAGKLDDAEKTVRAAIVIDPSDGEQGPGRRMRAYAVLASVLDRKGDKEHADIYHGAVTAIRMSERSDRFYEAGLLTRAVKMYEDALTHFADAYCIQSRLALRLSELGDNAGAEEHYRRAYELMPESFGRVESHCFGCERAFDGQRPQGIAEKVFTQLAAKMPEKPQVHYLLGYLHSEEGRYREALPEFEKAVKLDPDYLNAWKEIGELNGNMHIPIKLRNEVALNEVRLDPLHRHGDPQTDDVTDLAGIWKAAAAARDLQPPPSGPLLPLTASTLELKKGNPGEIGFEPNPASLAQPVNSISSNHFIRAVSTILANLPMMGTMR